VCTRGSKSGACARPSTSPLGAAEYTLAKHFCNEMPVLVLGALLMSPVQASERSTAIAAIFNDYCLSQRMTFEELDRRVSAAHYQVVEDRSIPLPKGQAMRQKNWLIPSQSGSPTMLTSSDVTNGPLHVYGCGVYAADITNEDVEPAFSALPRLGPPAKHTQTDAGVVVTWWSARVGDVPPSEDSQVMLSQHIPSIPGVGVSLIFKTHSDLPK
jgi:hypothetical protein